MVIAHDLLLPLKYEEGLSASPLISISIFPSNKSDCTGISSYDIIFDCDNDDDGDDEQDDEQDDEGDDGSDDRVVATTGLCMAKGFRSLHLSRFVIFDLFS